MLIETKTSTIFNSPFSLVGVAGGEVVKIIRNIKIVTIILITALMIAGCQSGENKNVSKNSSDEVRLITLAPAHFHAALVQKSMYPGIDSVVHVYAPDGLGLTEQLNYIKQ